MAGLARRSSPARESAFRDAIDNAVELMRRIDARFPSPSEHRRHFSHGKSSIAILPKSEYGRSVSLASCRTHLATHGSLRNQTSLLTAHVPSKEDATPEESNMAEKRLCPNCRSAESSRSHRNGAFEKYILGVLGVRPYRCMNCDVRFYAFSRFDEESSQTKKAA
jgi:hypothetical protein